MRYTCRIHYLHNISVQTFFVDGVRLSISTAELKKVKVGEVNTRPSLSQATGQSGTILNLCKAEPEKVKLKAAQLT